MARHDVLVIGGGISGASFALHALRAGRKVLLVEKEPRPGGCLHTCRLTSGFWYELGAHTCYNSYGAFLELLQHNDMLGALQARAKPVLRFLDDGRLLPGKNLGLLLRQFRKGELLRALPRWRGASQAGQTVRSYYSRLVGPTNYERVLGPMLSAVPSQRADDLPADMLFKKRERHKQVMRSFTLPRGLQSVVEAVLRRKHIDSRLGCTAQSVERAGEGWAVTLDDGKREEVDLVALATPPGAAAALLRGVAPELAEKVAQIREVELESLGFAVLSEKVRVPYSTFLIPLDDSFHSIVTRDVVPDHERRGFTFHFKPGLSSEQRLQRATEVLGVRPEDLESVTESRVVLPSPVLGHAELVAEIDRLLAPQRLALCGNWFGGLSIEDCAQRSRAEWQRLEPADGAPAE